MPFEKGIRYINILPLHKLLFIPSNKEWDALARTQPSVLKLFFLLVLPFSLIPPLMIEYAGHHYGADLYPHVSGQAWGVAALFFLLAELATVPLMAWGIRSVASSKGAACPYRDAFTLAAIAPVPLWLSSLVLFSDQPALIAAMVVLGVAGSAVMIFRGVTHILRVKEGLIAFEIAYIVTALGLIAWASLVMLGLVPALA